MTRLALALALVAACLTALPARAGELASVRSPSGVTLQASLEREDRLTIEILPDADIRLNGRLGVSLEATDGSAVWGTSLPLLILGEGDYFGEPVLETLHLAPAALEDPSGASLTFGACLPVTGICVLEEATLTLSRAPDGTLALSLAMLEP